MTLEDPQIPPKLQELLDETGANGQLEMHAVLHMLAATYLENNHKEFARHCCDFSSVQVEMRANLARP